MSDVAQMEHLKTISDVSTLELLYEELLHFAVTPGWVDREEPILWDEPRSKFVPALWRYAEMKAAIDAAGRLIDVSLAERRNLVLRNPIIDNNFCNHQYTGLCVPDAPSGREGAVTSPCTTRPPRHSGRHGFFHDRRRSQDADGNRRRGLDARVVLA